MIRNGHRPLFLYFVLAATFFAIPPPVSADITPRFRETHPLPDDATALVAMHEKADRILLDRARDGATARVELEYPDGTLGTGEDVYFTSEPQSLIERRPPYEAIVVGDRGCRREPAGPWSCDAMEIALGLGDIDIEHVIDIARQTVPCDDGPCDRITYFLLDIDDIDLAVISFNNATYLPRDPELNRKVRVLTARADGTPVSYSEWRERDGALVSPKATYVFDLDAAVPRPRLPEENDASP